MKKRGLVILSVLLMMVLSCSCFAADTTPPAESTAAKTDEISIQLTIDSPNMTINGVTQPVDPGYDTVPVIRDARTLIPVRALVEAMGGEVDWKEDTQTVTLTHQSNIITLTIGQTAATLNGDARTIDTTPIILGRRTMLPVRFIAEGFGWTVSWDADRRQITIVNSTKTELPTEATPPTEKESKTLLVYFSRTGTTAKLAKDIATIVDCDVQELTVVTPYPDDYNACLAQVQKEQSSGYEPPLTTVIDDMDQYDTIFIGYPIWYAQLPPPIKTFIHQYDVSEKTLIPFDTSGGSGLGNSVSQLRELCPNSTVAEGLAGNSATTEDTITAWLSDIGFPYHTAK